MERTAMRDLLLDCLNPVPDRSRATRLKGLSASDWETLLEQAESQGVGSLLYHRLRKRGLDSAAPEKLIQKLRERYRNNLMRNLYLVGELRRIVNALNGEGIPIIALKGIYLAPEIYDNIALREMQDIDLLVPVRGMARLVEVLRTMDYQAMRPFSIDAELATHLHLPRFIKPGAIFEIHWNITKPGERYSIREDELWERAVPTSIAGSHMLALSSEDLLLHLCLHSSYQHGFEFGLRPSCDIDAVVRYFGKALDWTQVQQRAAQWGWRRGVYLALRLAREMVGAAVPQTVLETLRPTDFDEAIAKMAREQVFADRGLAKDVGHGLAQLSDAKGRWRSGALLLGKFWRILRRLYPISPDVPGRRQYTHMWLRKVSRGRSRAIGRLLRGDREMALISERKRTLSNWLSHE